MSDSEIHRLLSLVGAGDSAATARLLPLIYDEMRHLARQHLRNERISHTLEPTGLVHETYLRLVGSTPMQ